MRNRRKCERYSFPSALEFSLIDVPGYRFEGVTVDISQSGLGIFTKAPVAEGQVLTIHKHILPLDCRKAEVRWVIEMDGQFRVGLMIVPSS